MPACLSDARLSGFVIFMRPPRSSKRAQPLPCWPSFSFGVRKGVFAPNGNLSSFYEAFTTASPLLRAPSRTLYQEIFENEHTPTTLQTGSFAAVSIWSLVPLMLLASALLRPPCCVRLGSGNGYFRRS